MTFNNEHERKFWQRCATAAASRQIPTHACVDVADDLLNALRARVAPDPAVPARTGEAHPPLLGYDGLQELRAARRILTRYKSHIDRATFQATAGDWTGDWVGDVIAGLDSLLKDGAP